MQIHLNDGFENESVRLFADGREVYSAPSVNSRKLTGVAAHIDLPDVNPPVELEIRLAASGLGATIRVARPEDRHLTFYVDQGTLKHILSSQPLGNA